MAKVKKASAGFNHFSLPSTHVTSFEFNQVRPTYYRVLNYGEKISVNLKMMCRTAPLTYPTFGNAQFIHRAFFIPFSLVQPYYGEFRSDIQVPTMSGQLHKVHLFHFSELQFIQRLVGFQFNNSWRYLGELAQTSDESQSGAFWNGEGTHDDVGESYLKSRNFSNDFVTVFCVRPQDPTALNEHVDERSLDYDFMYSMAQPMMGQTSTNRYRFNVYVKFKPLGRFIIKCLDSLGIRLSFASFFFNTLNGFNGTTVNTYTLSTTPLEFNALKMLCFLKCINDNYIPSQFLPTSPWQLIWMRLKNNASTQASDGTYYDLGKNTFSNGLTMLNQVLDCFKYAFQTFAGNNYFTDAWQTDSSPLYGSNSRNQDGGFTRDLTVPASSTNIGFNPANISANYDDVNGVTFKQDVQTADELNKLASAQGHTWLRHVYNYITRNNFAGNKVVENILARFGVKIPNYRAEFSEYIGKKMNPLQIQDVTASTSTVNSENESVSVLGEYAGKAWAAEVSGDKFTYECKEEGLFLILSSLVSTSNGTVQGTDRFDLTLDNSEFYNPEFEKVGMQPIAAAEFLVPCTRYASGNADTIRLNKNNKPLSIFGFAPRYSWMKYGRDFLTGDFRFRSTGGSRFGELNAYHMFRLYDEYYNYSLGYIENQDKLQPIETLYAQKDVLFDNGTQYNRIFNVTDNQQDHFFAVMQFDVSLRTKMLPITKSIDLDGFDEVNIQGNEALN